MIPDGWVKVHDHRLAGDIVVDGQRFRSPECDKQHKALMASFREHGKLNQRIAAEILNKAFEDN